jgi:hydroxypyruvate reductase
LAEVLPLRHGLLVAPHTETASAGPPPRKFHALYASHPLPAATSALAAEAALTLVRELRPEDLLVAAVSGGTSALLAKPAPGLTLADKVQAHQALLASGAPITAVNAVRTRLSSVKGGRLAAECRAPLVTLVLSDVVGGAAHHIGSGPLTAPGEPVALDAGLLSRLPTAIRQHLDSHGDFRWPQEKPKPEAALLASPELLAQAAARAASAAGFEVVGASADVAVSSPVLVAEVMAALPALRGRGRPACRIWVGEAPVAVESGAPGRGGRACHAAMLVAQALAGEGGVAFLAGASDGVDGNSGLAGAVVDGTTVARATSSPSRSVDTWATTFDSAAFHAAAGSGLRRSPTGTNLTDLMILAVA